MTDEDLCDMLEEALTLPPPYWFYSYRCGRHNKSCALDVCRQVQGVLTIVPAAGGVAVNAPAPFNRQVLSWDQPDLLERLQDLIYDLLRQHELALPA